LDYKSSDTFSKKIFFNLVAILINSKEVNPELFGEVPNSKSSVEFKFDIITSEYNKPSVSYLLQGPVNESGAASYGSIKFDRLKPGTYTLTSTLVTKKGKPLQITMPFSVVPMFWETPLFYVLAVLVLIGIILLVVRLYIRYNQRKEELRHQNERLIAEYKLIALKAQVNPHFMSNCLAAIQHLIRDNKSERATFYVARFGLLVRKILEFSSKQMITLSEELELLEIYLELEQLRFETKFIYAVEIDESISKRDVSIPPLLLNPIVENAVWHGLLPVQNKKQGQLLIHIARQGETLVITIEDNGYGRNANEIKGGESTGSYGTGLTQQRLQNMNFIYKTNVARMIYTDLVDPQGQPMGTQVTIYIPFISIYHEQD
jgi:hypothetical protein